MGLAHIYMLIGLTIKLWGIYKALRSYTNEDRWSVSGRFVVWSSYFVGRIMQRCRWFSSMNELHWTYSFSGNKAQQNTHVNISLHIDISYTWPIPVYLFLVWFICYSSWCIIVISLLWSVRHTMQRAINKQYSICPINVSYKVVIGI
jgi:hypothetical protein